MEEGWRSAALAEKIPERLIRNDLGPIQRVLGKEAQDLRVNWKFSLQQNWLRVWAKGEDSEAFLNLLLKRFGEAPVHHSKVERWDVLRGFLIGAGRVGFGVYVDIGVLEPTSKDALYPLHRMRAQLSDGQSLSCHEILEQNALVDDFPMKIVVTEIEGEKISVELADDTRETFLSWRSFPFDRVVAVGVDRTSLEAAVKVAKLDYDVIKVESLSTFVHNLVCKIGTDAPGVIAKIGGRLKGVVLASYASKRKLWAD